MLIGMLVLVVSLQATISTVQTPMLSFTICAAMAYNAFRYKLPPLTDPVAWLSRLYKMMRPAIPRMLFLGGISGFYAGFLTLKQIKTLDKVHGKILGQPVNTKLW